MMPDFSKGLVPAIIQDQDGTVLMLGYMNQEAFSQTLETKRITFFSRSKNRIWVKGESSGNFLDLISFHLDCDQDSILFIVKPVGVTCHTGSYSCFKVKPNFIYELEDTISKKIDAKEEKSYVASFANLPIEKIAQKVGEEAVETIIEAMKNDKERLINESSDLIFHLMIMLKKSNLSLRDLANCLESRKKS